MLSKNSSIFSKFCSLIYHAIVNSHRVLETQEPRMISNLPKKKYTQLSPGRVYYEFTLDKHLKELRDDEEMPESNNASTEISPSKNFLSKISFLNNCWYEAMCSIDGLTVVPRTKLMKSITESMDVINHCDFDIKYRLPKKAVKLKIDLFQPHACWVLDGLQGLQVQYKKEIDFEIDTCDSENKTRQEIQPPKKRWTFDPKSEYNVIKLLI